MDKIQPQNINAGRSKLEIASQAAIDAAAASLLADMEYRTAVTSTASDSLSPLIAADDYVTTLASTAEAIRVKLTSMIKARRQEYNTRLPINRLPVELLTVIFQLVMDCYPPARKICQLPTLAMVAAYWNTIVGATPSLWTTIGQFLSPETVRKALVKSKRMPLTVDTTRGSSNWWRTRCSDEEFYALITPHTYRWHTVDLDIDAVTPLSITSPAPLLQSLKLRGDQNVAATSIMDIFSGSAEGLKDLHLTNFYIPWDSALLQGLRTLSLNRLQGPTSRLTSHAVLKVLSACPELKKLELDEIDFVTSSQPNDHIPIHLPQLDSLLVSIRPLSFVNLLLSLVSAPRLASIRLSTFLASRNDEPTTTLSANVFSVSLYGSGDQLQDFASKGFLIPWAPGRLKGLRLLELKEITRSVPTADELLEVILANPGLEILRLSSIKVIEGSPTHGIHNIITLPRLKELVLRTTPSTFAHWMVSTTSAPQLSNMVLYLKLDEEDQYAASTLFNPKYMNSHDSILVAMSIGAACYQDPSILIAADSNETIMDVYGTSLQVCIVIKETAHVAALAWFSQFLGIAGVGHVPVRFTSDLPVSVVDLARTIAELLPQANEFSVRGLCMTDALGFLATPNKKSAEDFIRWPLPRLTHFQTWSGVSSTEVLAMVRSRAGLLAGVQRNIELPAAFQELSFFFQPEEAREEDVEEIEAIVGQHVFRWTDGDEC